MDYLLKKNPHPRDDNISLEESTHIYTVNGDTSYTSTTTWVHSYFSKFDADGIINRNWANWQANNHVQYAGLTKEEIKQKWEDNRIEASTAGTKMHYDIECYYNNIPQENDSIEYQYFKDYLNAFPELESYRTEWMVYHEELKLAGSIDMIYIKPNGNLMIYDWKRCKEIVKESPNQKYNSYNSHKSDVDGLSEIPDTNYGHYSLQLNIYKAILQEKYGKTVDELRLVCLHPANKSGSFEIHDVPDLQDTVKSLFNDRYYKLRLQDDLKKARFMLCE